MVIPENILLNHIESIAITERRPVSFRDCIYFEYNGYEYKMSHGTFRNKISNLIKKGKVTKMFHSNIAFYKPVGYEVGGWKMTDTGTGVSSNSPLYKLINNTVLNKNAVHNIRLKFECKNIWNAISHTIENKYDIFVYNNVYTIQNNGSDCIGLPDVINSHSNDIKFRSLEIKGYKIDVTIHNTDNVTIIIGCSYNPLTLDFKGYIEFSNLLTRVEERLVRLVNDCSVFYMKYQNKKKSGNNKKTGIGISSDNSNEDLKLTDNITTVYNNPFVRIPFYENWIITMWHFGADSIGSYSGERFHISMTNLDRTVRNIYSKQYGKRQKIRVERQEYPNKRFHEAIDEKLDNNHKFM